MKKTLTVLIAVAITTLFASCQNRTNDLNGRIDEDGNVYEQNQTIDQYPAGEPYYGDYGNGDVLVR